MKFLKGGENMKYETPRYFEHENHSFCFSENPNYKRGGFEEKYRLSLYDERTATYNTVGYPRNITEAKKMAKELIIIGG